MPALRVFPSVSGTGAVIFKRHWYGPQLVGLVSEHGSIAGGEGEILPDSEEGRAFGFTSDRFDGWLWKRAGAICVSAIESKEPGRGHVRALFEAVLAAGHILKVPTPLGRMQEIVRAAGMEQTVEDAGDLGECEVWVKRP